MGSSDSGKKWLQLFGILCTFLGAYFIFREGQGGDNNPGLGGIGILLVIGGMAPVVYLILQTRKQYSEFVARELLRFTARFEGLTLQEDREAKPDPSAGEILNKPRSKDIVEPYHSFAGFTSSSPSVQQKRRVACDDTFEKCIQLIRILGSKSRGDSNQPSVKPATTQDNNSDDLEYSF